jgi:hypothetical protein
LCRSGWGVPLSCLERYARDRAVRPIWLPTGQGFFFGAPRRCDLQHCHGLGAFSSSPWAKEGRCAKLPGLPTKEVPQDPAPLLDRPCLLEPAPPGFVFSPLRSVRPISRTPFSRSHFFARHLFLHCASVLVAWPPSAVLCDLPSFFATVSEVGCDEVSRGAPGSQSDSCPSASQEGCWLSWITSFTSTSHGGFLNSQPACGSPRHGPTSGSSLELRGTGPP